MNMCGILVHCAPGAIDQVATAMNGLDGVEVHMRTDDDRIIATVEDIGDVQAGDQILKVHRLDGVIAAALTYHHFEDEPAVSPAMRTGD